MYYGRNEACGLRCPYHGWKFDVSGRCVDMPNEPMQSRFKERVRIASYRCVERLGVIWTYMGNRKEPPRLPVLEWNCNPNNVPVLWRNHRACNWVQAMEGDLDSSHVNFLHRILDPAMGGTTTPGHPLPGRADDFGNANMADASPRFEVQQTEFGLLASAIRDRGDGTAYHRVHPFLFPFHTMIGGRLGDDGNLTGYHGKAWVPMDDEQTLILEWHLRPDLPWTDEERRQIIQNRNPHGFLPDNTLDPVGGWKSKANAENAFFWDYEVQRTKLFFGVTSNPLQDGAIQESMGHICDRTKEHLGTTDTAIIQMRKRLLSAARGVVKGEAAPGVDSPDAYAIRPSGAILPVGADWYRSTEDKRRIPVGLLSNLKA
jgi:phthalate 4,5-dioxygenase oxygenase subunit